MLSEEPEELASVWNSSASPLTFDPDCLAHKTHPVFINKRLYTLLYRKQRCNKCACLCRASGNYDKGLPKQVTCNGAVYDVVVHDGVAPRIMLQDTTTLTVDSWTLDLLVRWYCSKVSSTIPCISGAYICGTSGTKLVSKTCMPGIVSKITGILSYGLVDYTTIITTYPNFECCPGASVKNIVKQLVTAFESLSYISFSHGRPCSRNLCLNKDGEIKLQGFSFSSFKVHESGMVVCREDSKERYATTQDIVTDFYLFVLVIVANKQAYNTIQDDSELNEWFNTIFPQNVDGLLSCLHADPVIANTTASLLSLSQQGFSMRKDAISASKLLFE